MQDGLSVTSSRARRFGVAFQALSLYVSTGIAACGWGTSRLLEFDANPYLLLWFAGSVLAYNVDRLKPDPADPVNIPGRHAAIARLGKLSRAIIVIALICLIGIPISMRNWWLLATTLAAAFVCISYSIRLLGFRLKDVPILKSFFAPTIAVAAFIFPSLWQGSLATDLSYAVGSVFWLWMFLCFNMILCDLRDIEGDRRERTLSLPVHLGVQNTKFVLWLFLAMTLTVGLILASIAPEKLKNPWIILSLFASVFQTHLLCVAKAERNEAFYEWQVEGMLFVPALAVLVCHS